MPGFGSALGRTGRALWRSAIALVIGGACQNPGDLPDAEKRAIRTAGTGFLLICGEDDDWHRNGERLDEPGWSATELVTREAERFVRLPHAQPWLICVAHFAVHTPVDAPGRFKRLRGRDPHPGVRLLERPPGRAAPERNMKLDFK